MLDDYEPIPKAQKIVLFDITPREIPQRSEEETLKCMQVLEKMQRKNPSVLKEKKKKKRYVSEPIEPLTP